MDEEMASGGHRRAKSRTVPEVWQVGEADGQRIAGRYAEDLIERFPVLMGQLDGEQMAALVSQLAAAFARVVVTVNLTREEE